MDSSDGGLPGLAERLSHLFTTIPRPDGTGFWSNNTSARAITETGVEMTSGYMSMLRTGRRNNPTARLLLAIADLFGVPITYFLDEDVRERVDRDIAVVAALRQRASVKAAESLGLTPEGLSIVADFAEHIRRYDNLRHRNEDTG